jgi:acyl-CoA dehydrogenase
MGTPAAARRRLDADELGMLKELVRSYVDKELIPREAEVRRAGSLSRELRDELQAKARALDLWALDVPVELGGQGLELTPMTMVVEELARCAFPTIRAPLLVGDTAGILVHCTDEQRRRYLDPVVRGDTHVAFALTEAESGSDALRQMRTTAVRDGDDWVLNGSKLYVSNISMAGAMTVMAVTDRAKGAAGVTCFLVDTDAPGVEITTLDLMIPEHPGEVFFSDCRVPHGQVLGEVGQGMTLAHAWLRNNRLFHAARSIGRAQRALELAIEFARTRMSFGQPIAERQAIQFMVADSAMDLHAARSLLYQCTRRIDAGESAEDEIPVVKVLADEGAFRTCDRALQIFGGLGLSSELPVEQFFREVRSMRLTEGTSEIHRWRIARNIFKHDRWPPPVL